MQNIWKQIVSLRISLFFAGLTAILFSIPAQMHELYRAVMQSYLQADYRLNVDSVSNFIEIYSELAILVIGPLLLGLILWWAARRSATESQLLHATDLNGLENRPCVSLWLPRLVALVPLVFVSIGMNNARIDENAILKLKPVVEAVFVREYLTDIQSTDIPILMKSEIAKEISSERVSNILKFSDYLSYVALFICLASLVLLALIVLVDRAPLARFGVKFESAFRLSETLVAVAVIAAIILTTLTGEIGFATRVTTIGIVCLFLVCLTLITDGLVSLGRRLHFPILTLIVLLPILFSAFELTNNHAIRSWKPSDARESSRRLDVSAPKLDRADQAFARWFDSRKDTRLYAADKRYPIFIVAAQGGGIYAAKHVAELLSKVQDTCPRFSHHLFAISGVSGGSVGSAVFSALTTDRKWPQSSDLFSADKFDCRAGKSQDFSDVVEEVFKHDLLSPLVSRLMFTDFIQRFIPVKMPYLDRTLALEYGIEDAYANGVKKNKFGASNASSQKTLGLPYTYFWDPVELPHTPALLLNTTEVATGNRRVISPFTFEGAGLNFLPIWRAQGKEPEHNSPVVIPLSTASMLSARFPWITPAGYYSEMKKNASGNFEKVNVGLVDGGYFENSGVATALDLIKAIVRSSKFKKVSNKVEIILFIFTSKNFENNPPFGFSETMDPLRTMLNTRSARAGIEIENAIAQLEAWNNGNAKISANWKKLELNGYGYPLPLGWRLSEVTRHLISAQTWCLEKRNTIGGAGEAGLDQGCAIRVVRKKLN